MNNKFLNHIVSILFYISLFYIINVNYISNTISIISFIVAIITSYLLIYKNKNKLHPLKLILSISFSLFLILGHHYIVGDGNLLINTIKTIGYTFIFRNIFLLIDNYFYNFNNKEIKHKSKFINIFYEHPFIISFILISIVWSIYLIAFYPIVLSPDPSNQIKMYFNVPTHYIKSVNLVNPDILMTAHHPVLHTFLLGWSISIGRLIGSDNLGLFIYTLGQTIIYASVLAYTIKFLKNNKVNVKWMLILLFIYLIVPMYPFYAVSAVKDTLYTSFMILFVLYIIDIIKNNKKLNIKNLIYLFILLMLISMLRNNGKYVVILSIIPVIIFSKKNIKGIIITTLIFLLSFGLYDKVLIPSLGISPTSIRETLSVPFQQTARLVKKYPNFYNAKEKRKINKVLKYYKLADNYNPDLSDPVKNTFRKDATTKDLINYISLWSKGLIKHPILYIDATLNNTYGYISPLSHKWYLYHKYDTRITENNLVDYHFNKLDNLRNYLTKYGNDFPFIPIIGLISNIGFGTWVILTFSVYLILSKKKKYLITYIPLYGSLIFCFLGPANTYFRYAMPYLFVLPVLSILVLNEVRGAKNEK